MRFEKWQALGNDYLIVERDELPFELTPARVRRLCEAHFGVFADGVLELSPPSDPADVADLRIFNPDGSEAELSGNGAREAILYLRRRGWTELDSFSIHTAAGRIAPQITGPFTCRVDMGRASLTLQGLPRRPARRAAELRVEAPADAATARASWSVQHVSIGNPQCAIRVDDAAALRGARPAPRSARRWKATRSSPTARTSPGTPSSQAGRGRASARASSSAAWGRRCPPAPARRGAAIAYLSPARDRAPGPRRADARRRGARRRRAGGRGGERICASTCQAGRCPCSRALSESSCRSCARPA